MTTSQKQAIINHLVQVNGNLVRLLPFPHEHFREEVTRLEKTLHAFQASFNQVLADEGEDDDL